LEIQKKAIETKKQPQAAKPTVAKTQPASDKNDAAPQANAAGQQLSKAQKKKLRKQQKLEAVNGASDKENEANNEKPKEENKPKDDEKQTNETAATPTETAEKGASDTTKQTETKDEEKSPKKNILVEKTFPNGITIKDIKVGTGSEIKNGQSLQIYYAGQLLEDKTVFDKNLTGSGFPYKFGSDDAIKGWGLGMRGMKIGGKRRITVPPKFAYGAEGNAEKKVPANQTVIYTVEVLEPKTNP